MLCTSRTTRARKTCHLSTGVEEPRSLQHPRPPRIDALGIFRLAAIPRDRNSDQLRVRGRRPQRVCAEPSNAPDSPSADTAWTSKLHELAGLHVEVGERRRALMGNRVIPFNLQAAVLVLPGDAGNVRDRRE